MSYMLAGFVTASAVTLAIRLRMKLGKTYQVEATAERGECQVEASLEREWGSTTARRERGTTTFKTPPVFFLWSKVSASAQRGCEWSAANPLCMEWGRYTMCCTPCHRGMCEATASLPTTCSSKWDMTLAQYCSQLKKDENSPVSGTLVSGEFYSNIAGEELPEAVDFDWDVPPSDDALGSPISRSPFAITDPVGRSTPLGTSVPRRLSGATKRSAIISPLRTLPTRPPAPFRTSASADRGEVLAVISWGNASAACHRRPSVVHCPPFPFHWHKVAVTAGSWSTKEASLELQWGKWGCGLAERADEASAQLAHTWHSTHGHHSLDRQPAVANATATYCPPSTPKVFEPVTPERMIGACGDFYDDALPEAFEWEEGDKDSTPLSPLATRHTNRVKTPTSPAGTPGRGGLASYPSLAIPREGRLTPIRIGSTNRVVLSPNGDGVPRTIPPPLSSPSHSLPGTNRTKSLTAPTEKGQRTATHLPSSLPSALFPRLTPLSPVRQPKIKTNRIPTPTRTMA